MSVLKSPSQRHDSDSDDDDADYHPPEEMVQQAELERSSKRSLPLQLSSCLNEDGPDHNDRKLSPNTVDGHKAVHMQCPESIPSKRPRLEHEAQSKSANSIDQLWAEMNQGVLADTPKSSNSSPTTTDAHLSEWLRPAATPKPASKPLPSLAELEAKQNREKKQQLPCRTQNVPTAPKSKTGLEKALSLVRGVESDTILDKTRSSWSDFKTDDEIREELDHHKKDKNRYTDKVAFLERSDVREWEYERLGKKSRR